MVGWHARIYSLVCRTYVIVTNFDILLTVAWIGWPVFNNASITNFPAKSTVCCHPCPSVRLPLCSTIWHSVKYYLHIWLASWSSWNRHVNTRDTWILINVKWVVGVWATCSDYLLNMILYCFQRNMRWHVLASSTKTIAAHCCLCNIICDSSKKPLTDWLLMSLGQTILRSGGKWSRLLR